MVPQVVCRSDQGIDESHRRYLFLSIEMGNETWKTGVRYI